MTDATAAKAAAAMGSPSSSLPVTPHEALLSCWEARLSCRSCLCKDCKTKITHKQRVVTTTALLQSHFRVVAARINRRS